MIEEEREREKISSPSISVIGIDRSIWIDIYREEEGGPLLLSLKTILMQSSRLTVKVARVTRHRENLGLLLLARENPKDF